jgi:hypothetical protein
VAAVEQVAEEGVAGAEVAQIEGQVHPQEGVQVLQPVAQPLHVVGAVEAQGHGGPGAEAGEGQGVPHRVGRVARVLGGQGQRDGDDLGGQGDAVDEEGAAGVEARLRRPGAVLAVGLDVQGAHAGIAHILTTERVVMVRVISSTK